MKATDPKLAHNAKHKEYVLNIDVPKIQAFWNAVGGEQDDFTTSLKEGLELHKKYYSSDAKRRLDPLDSFPRRFQLSHKLALLGDCL